MQDNKIEGIPQSITIPTSLEGLSITLVEREYSQNGAFIFFDAFGETMASASINEYDKKRLWAEMSKCDDAIVENVI